MKLIRHIEFDIEFEQFVPNMNAMAKGLESLGGEPEELNANELLGIKNDQIEVGRPEISADEMAEFYHANKEQIEADTEAILKIVNEEPQEVMETRSTKVRVESYSGVFSGRRLVFARWRAAYRRRYDISAWGGETNISIFVSGGHYCHWHVVIAEVDSAIKSFSSAEYDSNTNINGWVECLNKELDDAAWWRTASPKVIKYIGVDD